MAKFSTNPMGDYSKKLERRKKKRYSFLYPKKRRKGSGCLTVLSLAFMLIIAIIIIF